MEEADSPSDLELAAWLAAGREDALEQLYDRYAKLVYSLAFKVLGDSARAEDAVQESFLKVWNNAGRFDANRGSVRAWLMTVVRNRSIDLQRGRSGREREALELPDELETAGSGSDPWREVASSLDRAAIRDAMESLPPEQRQAVELAYFHGYSCREIGEMTHVPVSTVKGRLRLALEKLASYLQAGGLIDV